VSLVNISIANIVQSCGKQITDSYSGLRGKYALQRLSRDLTDAGRMSDPDATLDLDSPFLQMGKSARKYLQRIITASGPRLPQYALRIPNMLDHSSSVQQLTPETCNASLNSSAGHQYLLLCIPTAKRAIQVHQVELCGVQSDREFFQLVKSTYMRRRGRLLPAMGLKKVSALQFTKVSP
jgi:hypothetical protein